MSTVDPRVRAAQRASQGFGTSGWLILALFLLVWVLAGIALGMALGPLRLIPLDTRLSNQTGPLGWGSFLVLAGTVIGGSVLGARLGTLLSYTRMGGPKRRVLPAVLAFTAVAMGLLVYLPFWMAPRQIGTQPALVSPGDGTAWSVTGWVFYAVPVWLPLLLIVVAAAIYTVPQVKRARCAQIRASRTFTQGVVTSTELTRIAQGGGTGSIGDPIMKVTVTFTDGDGTQRWVTKRVPYYRAGQPDVDTKLPVYYDPVRPGSTRRILVDFPDLRRA